MLDPETLIHVSENAVELWAIDLTVLQGVEMG